MELSDGYRRRRATTTNKPRTAVAVRSSDWLGIIMELYIKVSFWMGVVCLVLRVLTMAVREWPHKKTESLGEYVGGTILSLAFVVWAGIVLWLR